MPSSKFNRRLFRRASNHLCSEFLGIEAVIKVSSKSLHQQSVCEEGKVMGVLFEIMAAFVEGSQN